MYNTNCHFKVVFCRSWERGHPWPHALLLLRARMATLPGLPVASLLGSIDPDKTVGISRSSPDAGSAMTGMAWARGRLLGTLLSSSPKVSPSLRFFSPEVRSANLFFPVELYASKSDLREQTATQTALTE